MIKWLLGTKPKRITVMVHVIDGSVISPVKFVAEGEIVMGRGITAFLERTPVVIAPDDRPLHEQDKAKLVHRQSIALILKGPTTQRRATFSDLLPSGFEFLPGIEIAIYDGIDDWVAVIHGAGIHLEAQLAHDDPESTDCVLVSSIFQDPGEGYEDTEDW